MWGDTPVPVTAAWTSEAPMFLAPCRYAEGRRAVCQAQSIGKGQPTFAKPHMVRQRRAMVLGLCDLCGRPLGHRTKVSLSRPGMATNGAEGLAVLQVEPMLHVECAAASLQFCPSLRCAIRNATLRVRQVTRWRVQVALLSAHAVHEMTGQHAVAAGHAKIELIEWRDRDAAWLSQKEIAPRRGRAGHGSIRPIDCPKTRASA